MGKESAADLFICLDLTGWIIQQRTPWHPGNIIKRIVWAVVGVKWKWRWEALITEGTVNYSNLYLHLKTQVQNLQLRKPWMSICFLVIRGLSRDFPASIWDRSRTDSFSLPKSLRNPCFSVVFMPLLFNWYVVYSAVSQTFIKAIPLDPCLLLRKTFVSFSLEIQIQSCVYHLHGADFKLL